MRAYDFMRAFLDKGFEVRLIDRDGSTEIRATKDGNTVAGILSNTERNFGGVVDPYNFGTLLEDRVNEMLRYWTIKKLDSSPPLSNWHDTHREEERV